MASPEPETAAEWLALARRRPPEERPAFLDSLRQTNAALADEVASLLSAYEAAAGANFLESRTHDAFVPATDEEVERREALTADWTPGNDEHHSSSVQVAYERYTGRIGDDYELRNRLGSGGMGAVYLAYQRSLDREVALKIIHPQYTDEPERVARLHQEAESAGRLDHPGVVGVLEVGESNGIHYYAMPLIRGRDLESYVSGEERISPRRAAQVIRQVGDAVQHAHDHGIIHRDIKPANVLIDEKGEPRLTDFGLAKVKFGGRNLTHTMQVLGTPAYMSPEQASTDGTEVDERTDVYALGATLYALLARRPPFAGESAVDVIVQVVSKEPPPLSDKLHVDLRTICECCLAKEPHQRYQSAQELVEDLDRYLDGRPILRRPLGPLGRAWRWAKRNRAVASLLASIAALLVIGTIVSSTLAVIANVARADAVAYADNLREAVSSAIETSERELADEPGTQELRKVLLELATRYRNELRERGDASDAELAEASLLFGKVSASLDNWDDALNGLADALNRRLPPAEQAEADAAALTDAAEAYNELQRVCNRRWEAGVGDADEPANAEATRGVLDEWLDYAERCVEFRRRASEREPDSQELRRQLANGLMNQATALREVAAMAGNEAELGDAVAMLEEAETIRNSLAKEAEEGDSVFTDIALGTAAKARCFEELAKLAKSTEQPGHRNRALQLHTIAAKQFQEALAKAWNTDTAFRLGASLEARANALYDAGRLEESREVMRDSIAAYQQVADRNPRAPRYQRRVAYLWGNLWGPLLESAQRSESVDRKRELLREAMNAMQSCRDAIRLMLLRNPKPSLVRTGLEDLAQHANMIARVCGRDSAIGVQQFGQLRATLRSLQVSAAFDEEAQELISRSLEDFDPAPIVPVDAGGEPPRETE